MTHPWKLREHSQYLPTFFLLRFVHLSSAPPRYFSSPESPSEHHFLTLYSTLDFFLPPTLLYCPLRTLPSIVIPHPQVPFASIAGDVEPTGEMVAGYQLLPKPSVTLLNSYGTILQEADNVIFVSVVEISNKPRTFPPLVLSSTVSDHSCCRRPTCLQSMARMVIECDCSHPAAGAVCRARKIGHSTQSDLGLWSPPGLES